MLKGKTAVATGGTRGIGFAIAQKYLENGAKVAIAGSRQETVEKALAQLADYKERVMGIWPDLCSLEEVAAAERVGRANLCRNSVGASGRAGGCCERLSVSGQRYGVLCDGNCSACRRRGNDLKEDL